MLCASQTTSPLYISLNSSYSACTSYTAHFSNHYTQIIALTFSFWVSINMPEYIWLMKAPFRMPFADKSCIQLLKYVFSQSQIPKLCLYLYVAIMFRIFALNSAHNFSNILGILLELHMYAYKL